MDPDASLRGRHILIVEDDFLVAQYVADILEEAGVIVIGPIGFAKEALAFVEQQGTPIDGAVLDINLHGETSYRVADALAERGIGFVFTTGYGDSVISDAYRHYPRCQKPFEEQALLRAVAAA